MAFPVTITNHFEGSAYPFKHQGPYLDNSGNLWVFGYVTSSGTTINAFKSTDSGNTWGTTFANSLAGSAIIDVWFDTTNQVFYVLTTTSASVIQVFKFTIATTTWSRFDTGTGPTVSAAQLGVGVATICPGLSSGAFVVHYQTNHVSMSVTWHNTNYITLSSAGVWGTGTNLSPSNTTNDYSVLGCVQGASNRVHCFYTQSTTSPFNITHRSISSGAVLDTAADIASGFVCASGNNTVGMGASYYDGTNVWVGPAYSTTTGNAYSATSAANPTWTAQSAGGSTENGRVYYDGTTEWMWFNESTPANEVYLSRTGTSGSWGSRTTGWSGYSGYPEPESGGLLFLAGGSTQSKYAPYPGAGGTNYTESATVSGVTTVGGGEIRTTTIYKAGIIAQTPTGISPPPQVSIRAKRGGSDSGYLLVSLYDGAVLVDSWTITLTSGFNTYTHQIANGSLISDWSQLQIWVQGSSDPGASLTATVSWVRLNSLPQIQQMGTSASKPLLMKLGEHISRFHLLNGPPNTASIIPSFQYTDSATVSSVTSLTSTETTDYVESATIGGVTSPSVIETTDYVESATISSVTSITSVISDTFDVAVPKALLIRLAGRDVPGFLHNQRLNPDDSVRVNYVESATISSVTSVQSSENANFVDTGGSVQGTSSVSSTESTDYIEAQTVAGVTTPSAADIAAYVDAATVSGVTSLTATETTDYVDSSTVAIVTSLISFEYQTFDVATPHPLLLKLGHGRPWLMHNNILGPVPVVTGINYIDAATVSGVTSVQSTESTDFLDSGGTVQGTSSITYTEVAAYIDASTCAGVTSLSATETTDFVDAATVAGVTSVLYQEQIISQGAIPRPLLIALERGLLKLLHNNILNPDQILSHVIYTEVATVSTVTDVSASIENAQYVESSTIGGISSISSVDIVADVEVSTVTGTTSVSSVDVAAYIDSNTVVGTTSLSATDLYAGIDANTIQSITDLSGSSDVYNAVDSATASGVTTVSTTLEEHDIPDSGTVSGTSTVTSADIAQYVESATLAGVTSLSATETTDFVDSFVVAGVTSITSSEIQTSAGPTFHPLLIKLVPYRKAHLLNNHILITIPPPPVAYVDSATITSVTIPSSVDTADTVESQTVSGKTAITVIETTQDQEAATAAGNTNVTFTETTQYVDLSTTNGVTTISATDFAAYVDSITCASVTTLTSQEAYGRVDSSTVLSNTTPSSVDIAAFVETDTISAITTVTYSEQYISNPTQTDAATITSITTVGAAEVEFIVELVGSAAKHFIVLGVAEHYSASSTMHFTTEHDKHYEVQAVNQYASS